MPHRNKYNIFKIIFLMVFLESIYFCFVRQDVFALGSEHFTFQKTLNNNVLCTQTITINPESKNKISKYKKIVEISKNFNNKEKNGINEDVINFNCKIVFTYDKQNLVEISNDIIKNTKIDYIQDDWKIVHLIEIFPNSKVCLVSVIINMYRENKKGILEYQSSSHTDVFCSTDGLIAINTNV